MEEFDFEEELEKVFDSYVEFSGETIIKKRPFAEYFADLYNKGEIKFIEKPLAEHYWRRSSYEGFHLIEKYNEIRNKVVMKNDESELRLPKIKDSVEKLKGNPEKLIKTLAPYERELSRMFSSQKKNELRIKKLNEEVLSQKERIGELEKHNDILQETIYKLFYYSKDRQNTKDMVNLLTTTKNASVPVKNALQSMFDSDVLGYLQTEDDVIENVEPNNIVDLNRKREKSPATKLWDEL